MFCSLIMSKSVLMVTCSFWVDFGLKFKIKLFLKLLRALWLYRSGFLMFYYLLFFNIHFLSSRNVKLCVLWFIYKTYLTNALKASHIMLLSEIKFSP